MNYDIRKLNYHQRKAIGKMAVHAVSIEDMPGVGQRTIDSLVKEGLAEIAPGHDMERIRYRLTPLGDYVYDELYRDNRIPQ